MRSRALPIEFRILLEPARMLDVLKPELQNLIDCVFVHEPLSIRYCKNSGVATHRCLALSIVAREVCDRAIANGYQVTTLQQVPPDPAAIDECTVFATEIYKTNTGCRVNDQRMLPAHNRTGHRDVT